MRWQDLVQQVQFLGQYTSEREAERVLHTVLTALGPHVTGEDRFDLAQRLPEQATLIVAQQPPAPHAPGAARFVDTVAARLHRATRATARWDVSAVLDPVARQAGEDLTARIIAALPEGYCHLFGRAELTTA
ncbi:DUF2267 domain-containing protein [Streptomyces sp. ODS28]|uniref:DUF2267 domain-containing protein n=1 Tax=Streptomyces sp. ODS28 TaxID=3136688 RepID=UPI0031E94CA9